MAVRALPKLCYTSRGRCYDCAGDRLRSIARRAGAHLEKALLLKRLGEARRAAIRRQEALFFKESLGVTGTVESCDVMLLWC